MQDDNNKRIYILLAVVLVALIYLWFNSFHLNWLKIYLGYLPDYCGNIPSEEKCEELVEKQKNVYQEFTRDSAASVKFDCEKSTVERGKENLLLTAESEEFITSFEGDLEDTFTELNTVDMGKLNKFEAEVMKRLREDPEAPIDAPDLIYDEVIVTTFKKQFCTFDCFSNICSSVMKNLHMDDNADTATTVKSFFAQDTRYHQDYKEYVQEKILPLINENTEAVKLCELLFYFHFHNSIFDNITYNQRDLGGSCFEYCKSGCTGDECPAECSIYDTEKEPLEDSKQIFIKECDSCGCKENICPGDFSLKITSSNLNYEFLDSFRDTLQTETETDISYYIKDETTKNVVFHITNYTTLATKESIISAINQINSSLVGDALIEDQKESESS